MNFFKKLLFARAISFQEGKFSLFGIRGVMIPSKTFAMLQYEVLKKDPDTKEILFDVGRQQAKIAIESAKKMASGSSAIVDLLTNSVSLMGLGKLELINPNIDRGNAVFHVKDSAVASEYKRNKYKAKESVDHYLLGLLHGAVEEITSRTVTSKETKCIAKGDPYCEFVCKGKA
jgi:predicted hydrocarbon binding protein